MSRDHLRIWPTPGALLALDRGSTNGTSRNGEPLVGTVALRSGDRLELGSSVLVVIGDPPRAEHLRPVGARVVHRSTPSPDPRPPSDRWWEAQPDLAAVTAAIAGWSPRLWSRPLAFGDGPRVRLGDAAEASSGPGHPALMLDLAQHREVAVVGESRATAELVAAWLLQLGACHSPDALALKVSEPPGGVEAAGWLAAASAWLPHRGEPEEHREKAWELTVLADSQLPGSGGSRSTTVWLLAPGEPLPRGCRAVIEVGAAGQATIRTSRPAEPAAELAFVADRVDPATFAILARLLAPLCTRSRPASS